MKDSLHIRMAEATPGVPTLTVEKVDPEPRHGDDMVEEKDADKLGAQDAEVL